MARAARSNNARLFLCLPCLVFSTGAAQAGDWKLNTGLNLVERYTDNLNLTPGGSDAFVTEITPRMSLRRQGARGDVSLAYNLNALLYDHDPGNNRIQHGLDATLRVEPIRHVLTLNGAARIAQQSASQFAATATGGYHNNANQVETRTITLQPKLHNEFFDRHVALDMDANLGLASTDSATVNTSSTLAGAFSLRTRKPDRLSWGLQASANQGRGSGATATTTTTTSQNANVGFAVSRAIKVFAAAGRNGSQNINLLNGRGGTFTTGGVTWSPDLFRSLTLSAGVSGGDPSYGLTGSWSPSPRLNFSATLGRRGNADSYNLSGAWTPSALTRLQASVQKNFDSAEFGSGAVTNGLSAYGFTSYQLSLSQKIRRAALSLSYNEAISNASQQYDLNGLAPYIQCGTELRPAVAGEAVPEGCTVVAIPVVLPQALNQSTFNKTWTGSVGFNLGKSLFSFSFSQTQRELLGPTPGSDQSASLGASWSLPLSGRTSTSLTTNWTSAEAATQNSDAWALTWSLNHRLNNRMSGSLTARHSAQNTNVAATGDIAENSISANLGMTF